MEVMRKHYKIITIFIFVFTTIVLTCEYSQAHDKFVKLNFTDEDGGKPVALSENEIFLPGGSYNKKTKSFNTAKIYNIKDHTLIDTSTTMNTPRYSYEAIKYDNNYILIVGGFCSDNNKNPYSCSQTAEIYNVKENKFTKISDTNLKYKTNIHAISLDKEKVFILSGSHFEIFNPVNNEFSIIANRRQYNSTRHEYMYTINNYASSDILQINQNEILIYGTRPLTTVPDRELFAMEIFNLETKKSINIPVDYSKLSYINIGSPIKIDDEKILFVGAGIDKKDVVKFNLKTKSFENYSRLPLPLSSDGFLLNNSKVLFVRGSLFTPDYFRGTSLERAIYDCKTNKIYNYKTSHKSHYTPKIINLDNNSVYISGYKTDEPLLYKY